MYRASHSRAEIRCEIPRVADGIGIINVHREWVHRSPHFYELRFMYKEASLEIEITHRVIL